MAIITCQNLSLGYDGKEIVHDLNFEVHTGDYLCIVGENGSGKSTLMRTLLGLQPLLSGSVLIGGGLKRRQIGYLPQQTQIQRDFPASVWEVVLSGCQARSRRIFYGMEGKRLARENIERLGIAPLTRRCYRELSGGQQQRVLLARALCATRKLLLLDEPVSGLDPKATEELYRLIKDLNGEGVTIFMISHDIAAAVEYASHILHIGGRMFYGTKQAYLQSDIGRLFARKGGQSNA